MIELGKILTAPIGRRLYMNLLEDFPAIHQIRPTNIVVTSSSWVVGFGGSLDAALRGDRRL